MISGVNNFYLTVSISFLLSFLFILQISCLGAAETFRGLGMASLVTLLIFSLIQWLLGQNEDKSMFLPAVLQQKVCFAAVKPATAH